MPPASTDEEIRELTQRAPRLSLVILRWTAARDQPGADLIERDHQHRLLELRAQGEIVVMAPVLSGEIAGVLMMSVPVDEATGIIAGDPCVQAGMQTFEVHPCLGVFPDTGAS